MTMIDLPRILRRIRRKVLWAQAVEDLAQRGAEDR
jgi:hypothetical protein